MTLPQLRCNTIKFQCAGLICKMLLGLIVLTFKTVPVGAKMNGHEMNVTGVWKKNFSCVSVQRLMYFHSCFSEQIFMKLMIKLGSVSARNTKKN